MASVPVARVHPVVLFSIVDSYEKRKKYPKRVIGTLLGNVDKTTGAVEVTNCFTVPHNESEDEVAIDIEFARTMFDLHRKVNSSELIVGWYSTAPDVTEHSVLIHEYYSRECKNPIHITVDTTLKGSRMGLKAYTGSSMGVPGGTQGTMFTPINVEMTWYDPEKVGLDFINLAKHTPKRSVSMVSELHQVGATCAKLHDMMNTVTQYVDDVLAMKKPADNATGRHLMDLMNSVPKIDPEQFEEMTNTNMKDLLMVVYLSNLTRTQLMLKEKLSIM